MTSIWFDAHPPTAPTSEFVPGAQVDTIVVGAGLTGLTTATLLARSGQRVALLEARRVGAVTTGHTTAKLSLLQGSVFSGILKHHSEQVLQAYVEANREGQAWLTRFMDEHGVDYQRRTAWTYAVTEQGGEDLRTELDACRTGGLDVAWRDESELPFDIEGAITLADQVQIDPLAILDALLADFAAHGGILMEQTRVTEADTGSPITVTTTRGTMTADHLVVATGTPVLGGRYFAKLVPLRSYVTTYRVPGAIPQGMYLSVDDPARSLRTVEVDGAQLLMVGGNGHVVGRADSEAGQVADLEAWAGQHFPGAVRTHSWSAQDYQSINRVPFVGPMPGGGEHTYVATGFNKWGMTNGVAAGLNLSAQILGGHLPWADTLGKRVTKPAGIVSAIAPNAEAAVELAKDWVGAELHGLPDVPPAEGEGVVGRGSGGKPEAVSTVDGVTCRVSAVCTHLGGVVRWNDAEKSWDCPLHGSRFAADGTLLEGPAVTDLAGRDAD